MYIKQVALFTVILSCCRARNTVVEMELLKPDISHLVSEYSENSKPYSADRNFSFASYYNDHMVLQSSPKQAVVWGYAPNGTQEKTVQVVLRPSNQKRTAIVTTELTWFVKLDPVAAGGPYTLVASLAGVNITLSDLLFGDVWVCSGQSNMQFPLKNVFNATEEIIDATDYKDLRVFVVSQKTSNTPLADLPSDGIALHWSPPSLSSEFAQFSAVCWLYGKYLYQHLKKPLGLVETCWGGTPVEAWSSPDALAKCGLADTPPVISDTTSNSSISDDLIGGPNENSVLWNGMVHPLLNMTIFGAIWYQGEANVKENRNKYNCSFPTMIDDWRKKFHASSDTDALFPFGFVQLAGCHPDYMMDTGFPDIRWHQTADYGYVPNHRQRNVFMAVAMDLPDFLSPYLPVHPRDKQDVCDRLSRSGLAVAYKQNVSFQGPYPVHIIISEEEPYNYTQVEIQYSQNLEQRWLDGFEICCSFATPPVCTPDKSWWLPTTTMQAYNRGNVTESYASQCSKDNLVGIRYGWRESPCPFKKCAIYGATNGLPMPPFSYYDEGFRKVLTGNGRYEVRIVEPNNKI